MWRFSVGGQFPQFRVNHRTICGGFPHRKIGQSAGKFCSVERKTLFQWDLIYAHHSCLDNVKWVNNNGNANIVITLENHKDVKPVVCSLLTCSFSRLSLSLSLSLSIYIYIYIERERERERERRLNEHVKREHTTGFTSLWFSSVITMFALPLLFTHLTLSKQLWCAYIKSHWNNVFLSTLQNLPALCPIFRWGNPPQIVRWFTRNCGNCPPTENLHTKKSEEIQHFAQWKLYLCLLFSASLNFSIK